MQKLEIAAASQVNPLTVIAMNCLPSPEDALLIEQAESEGREILKINIVNVSGCSDDQEIRN